jgi:hypothetical protein
MIFVESPNKDEKDRDMKKGRKTESLGTVRKGARIRVRL